MTEKKATAATPKKAAPAAAKAAPAAKASTTAVSEKTAFRRKIVGRVIRDKMDKTVVVECVNARRDPLYGKYVKTRQRFKAHDETNQYKIGDQVEIQEHRPLSRDKRFIVVRLVRKFIEE